MCLHGFPSGLQVSSQLQRHADSVVNVNVIVCMCMCSVMQRVLVLHSASLAVFPEWLFKKA